jgi:hypothetical protein
MNTTSTDFYYYYDTSVRSEAITWYSKMTVVLVLLGYIIRCSYRCWNRDSLLPAEPQILCSLLPEKYTNISEVDDLETCTICIDDFEEGDEVIKLVCKHSFHPKCIVPWLEKSAECPNCKTKIY